MTSTAVTIKDVAREAKVSVATVSRALNGHGNVAESVRRHVQEIAERLRYQPHAAARSLSSRRTHTLGVVASDLCSAFFSELMRGMGQVAHRCHQHLLVSGFHAHAQDQAQALRTLRGRVDGVLLCAPQMEDPAFLREHLPAPLPMLLINTPGHALPYPAVNIDHYAGAKMLTTHLIQAGHRRIAFIEGPREQAVASERLRGYRDALAQSGQVSAGEWPGDFSQCSGYRAGQQLLAAGHCPEAVFAANDEMALGCLYALNEAGVKVPEQIALAGFGDSPLAHAVHPPLTTMRVDIAQLGGQAVSRLLAGIEDPSTLAEAVQPWVPELIVRGSSARQG